MTQWFFFKDFSEEKIHGRNFHLTVARAVIGKETKEIFGNIIKLKCLNVIYFSSIQPNNVFTEINSKTILVSWETAKKCWEFCLSKPKCTLHNLSFCLYILPINNGALVALHIRFHRWKQSISFYIMTIGTRVYEDHGISRNLARHEFPQRHGSPSSSSYSFH